MKIGLLTCPRYKKVEQIRNWEPFNPLVVGSGELQRRWRLNLDVVFTKNKETSVLEHRSIILVCGWMV